MQLFKTKMNLGALLILMVIMLLASSLAFSRVSGGNEWGKGNTMEEACANAKARVRMICENPVMEDCECNTFDPRARWSCNVTFTCQ